MRQGLFSLVASKSARDFASELRRILLYQSEAARIARYARSSPHLEIGGDMFGFYTPAGEPLVFVTTGPGPAARRDATHFQQDPEFQTRIFNQLASKFRMFYIGDWHSHHSLGLSEPSGSDDAKLRDLARKNGWPQLFSLIVQTELTDHRSRYHGRYRDEPSGPTEEFGIWWNAFHYQFREEKHFRHRVEIDFQAEQNPYQTTSDSIDATIQQDHRSRDYESRGFASAVLPPIETLSESRITISADEFLLKSYQEICRELSRELHNAQMEVDLEASGGPCLVVLDGQQSVKCSILGHCDSTVRVEVSPQAREKIEFEVSCKSGRIAAVEMLRIVACVVSQIKPPDSRDRPGKRA